MEHIAIFRMSAMGDVAISVPIVTAFADQYPEVKITYVTRPLFAPMFAHIPNLEVFSPELNGKHAGLCGLYRLYKELKAKGIDGVADIHNVLRTNILRLYFKGSGIPFAQINKGRIEKQALTRYRFKSFHPLKPSYQRYADVFATLGFPIDLTEDYLLSPPDISETVQRMLSDTVNIGVAPFASYEGKQYPFEKMCEVIQQLSAQYPNGKIYIFGGGKKEEEKNNEKVAQYLRERESAYRGDRRKFYLLKKVTPEDIGKKELPQFNIIHEGKGRGNAYTMGVYRYTTIDKFLKAKSTADL